MRLKHARAFRARIGSASTSFLVSPQDALLFALLFCIYNSKMGFLTKIKPN